MGFPVAFGAKSQKDCDEHERDDPLLFWREDEAVTQVLKSCTPVRFQLPGCFFTLDRTRRESYFRLMLRS